MKFLKDPSAVLDYTVDWTTWLSTDVIATSSWTVPNGLTKGAETKTEKTASIWLSGGTVGQEYTVVNKITTAAGRTDERTIIIAVVER